jgi:hypothetical protein
MNTCPNLLPVMPQGALSAAEDAFSLSPLNVCWLGRPATVSNIPLLMFSMRTKLALFSTINKWPMESPQTPEGLFSTV